MRILSRTALALVGVLWTNVFSQSNVGQFSIGLLGGPIKMAGDVVDFSTVEQWIGISSRYVYTDRVSFGVEAAGGWVRAWNGQGSMFNSANSLPFKTNLIALSGNAYIFPFRSQRFSPFVNAGAGFIFWDVRDLRTSSGGTFANGIPAKDPQGNRLRKLSPSLSGALGFDYHFNDRFALTSLARLHGMLKGRQDTSGLQGNISGTGDANYLVVEGQLGLRYSFGGRPRAQSPDEDLFSSEETSPFGDPSGDAAFGGASPFEETDPFASGSADSGMASDLDMQEYIRLKSLSDELTQGIELKEREISSLQETLFDRRTKLSDLESGKISASNGVGADRSMAQPRMDAGAMTGSTASFSLAYERGLSLLTAKRYQEAINIFSDLVARFPSHALASHCHYWNGEAYFNLGNYQAAITALNNVLQSSLSLKKDNALLYLGRSYVQLNRTDEARRVFNQLIQEYPTSEFVGTAEEMLAKL